MHVQHTRDWVDILEALGPLIAVIAVLIVGFVQAYLQRQQLKQDLFDRRFRVYDAMMKFVLQMFTGVPTDLSAHSRFTEAISAATFLFGPKVTAFLGRLTAICILDVKYDAERKLFFLDAKDGTFKDKVVVAIKETCGDGLNDIGDVFNPYLQLHRETPWPARFIARINRWVDQEQPATMASRYEP